MLLLASNLKYLRKATKVSQQDVADFVGLASSAMSGYENGKFYPTVDVLAKLCQFFQIKADDILFKDLSVDSSLSFDAPAIPSVIKGNNVLVPVGAQAGYAMEWTQEYIRSLTFVAVPGIEGEARTFEISGNSMNPILMSGDFVSCISVADVTKIENNRIYVVVGRQSGIHVKYLQLEEQRVLCIPANREEFETYYLDAEEIQEIWEAKVKITNRIVDLLATSSSNTDKKLRSLEEFLKGKFPDLIVTE